MSALVVKFDESAMILLFSATIMAISAFNKAENILRARLLSDERSLLR